MTQATPHGFPDWGRFANVADNVYFDQTVPDIDAATTYGPFFVGDVPYIYLHFEPIINNQAVAIDFYTDAATTNRIGEYGFEVPNGYNVRQSMPVLASYVKMRVTPNAINSSFLAELTSMGAGGRIPSSTALSTRLIGLNSTAIGAGATVQSSAGNVWPGEAVWSVRTNVATFDAFLESEDRNGVFTILDHFTQASTERWRTVMLPPTGYRIRVVNTSGAAGTVSFYLNAKTSLYD